MISVVMSACAGDGPTGIDRVAAPRLSVTASASSITIGAPGNTFMRFPFGGALNNFAGTRYQQAYAASSFNGASPMQISGFSFLDGQGELAAGTYTVYLSHVTADVDNLSETNFDANRGADNTLFATVDLSGPAPATLTFTGLAPFEFDPSRGNLLVDIVVSTRAAVPAIPAAYAARTDAFGVFSRYQDFGFSSIGLGLVTRFELAGNDAPPGGDEEPTIDGLIAAAEKAALDGTLLGYGPAASAPGRLKAWLNVLHASKHAAATGNDFAACAQLKQAYQRADGNTVPGDFVTGPAVPELIATIAALVTAMGCD
jgi:hypothetical protein